MNALLLQLLLNSAVMGVQLMYLLGQAKADAGDEVAVAVFWLLKNAVAVTELAIFQGEGVGCSGLQLLRFQFDEDIFDFAAVSTDVLNGSGTYGSGDERHVFQATISLS